MVGELLRRSTGGAYGTAGTVTFGVVIFVPEPGAAELAATRLEVGDRFGSLIPPHVTVLPPTTRPVHQIREIKRHLRRIGRRQRPFLIHLRGTDSFRPVSPVVFARLAEGREDCAALEAQVRCGVLFRELTFDYHPHITLAYGLDDVALDLVAERMAGYDLRFLVREFHLVVFDTRARPRVETTIRLHGR